MVNDYKFRPCKRSKNVKFDLIICFLMGWLVSRTPFVKNKNGGILKDEFQR